MFEKFSDYMYSLLFTPLKKVRQAGNQFYLFFKVVGKLFDDTKAEIFREREESMVASASEVMLPEHGRDRDMTRLKGETVEGYRTRLSMKALIAEKAGTEAGILLALAALGYEHSYIERMSLHDTERWAEFIVFLGGKYPSGVNDIAVIDAEVMKVKEASSKPFYGIEERNIVEIREKYRSGLYVFPICGRFKCGQFPYKNNNVGYLLGSRAVLSISYQEGCFHYALCGTMRAQEPPYIKGDIIGGRVIGSVTELRVAYQEGRFPYLLSGAVRLSQGIDNGRSSASVMREEQELGAGEFAYILSGSSRLSQGVDNGRGSASELQEESKLGAGSFSYRRPSQGEDNGRGSASELREESELGAGSFSYKRPAQGEDNGKTGASDVQAAQEFSIGLVSYARSGQRRAGQRKE